MRGVNVAVIEDVLDQLERSSETLGERSIDIRGQT
jgi:hypothetical protein